MKKRSSTKKKSIVTLEREVFLESLKHMISELMPHVPKEILIEARTFLNNLFTKMKDQFDSYYAEKYTVKERNKVWENIAKNYQIIFQSFIEIINRQSPKNPYSPEKLANTITLNHAIKLYQGAQIRRNWPNPFEIDFLNIREPNDVATISCRIGDLVIPHAILDTGADDSLFTDNIPRYLGEKIDKKNVHKLTGAVGDSQSIGTSYNIPITIGTEEDSITVSEKEISVIPTKKDRNGNDISIMILGTKWQHRVGWEPIVKGEFIATHNGKTIKIPLSTRKEKYSHNVSVSDKGGAFSHDEESRPSGLLCNNVYNTEKWHAPKDFKLPDSLLHNNEALPLDTTITEQIPEEQKKINGKNV